MDEEIKLILTKLKLVSEIEESGAYICDKEHSRILYDYITNLQEELEEEKRIEQASLDTINNLQEENERLKQKLEENTKIYLNTSKYASEMEGKYIITKSIIDELEKDLKTLWNVCWNNDTEMTSYQNEIFDKYYDKFHKKN